MIYSITCQDVYSFSLPQPTSLSHTLSFLPPRSHTFDSLSWYISLFSFHYISPCFSLYSPLSLAPPLPQGRTHKRCDRMESDMMFFLGRCPIWRKRCYCSNQAAASHFHDTNIRDQYHYSVSNCVRSINVKPYVCTFVFTYLISVYMYICM